MASVQSHSLTTRLEAWYAAEEARILDDLCAYLSVDTTSPQESAAQPFLRQYLEPLGFSLTETAPPSAFWDHSERAPSSISNFTNQSRCLRAHRAGLGGRHLIVNAHVDVVPLQDGFAEGFVPIRLSDRIIGRGAVDTKGNLIMLVEALRFLISMGAPPCHELTLDLVAEEEVGGNGALASALSGTEADCALVLEPTNGEVFIGHRGCVTFSARFSTRGRHMGDKTASDASAIDAAAAAVAALRDLEVELDNDKAELPAFQRWPRAVQVNVGEITGGDWYGSVPSDCRLTGNCGFLPVRGLAGTQEALEAVFERVAERFDGVSVEVTWPALRNEAYICDATDAFLRCLASISGQTEMRAWNVSCDGRHYSRLLGLPTAIFGFGTLTQAHSVGETLKIEELRAGISAMVQILSSSLGNEI